MEFSTADISQEEVIDFLARLIRFSQRSARLAAAYLNTRLKRGRHGEDGLQKIPEQFALEVGAFMQLAEWEHAGLSAMLPADLPTASEAERSMWKRITESPREYVCGNSGSELAWRVLETWLLHFAPAGLEELATNIVVQAKSAEDPLEEIADLLWEFRHLAQEENHDPSH